jgi:hypothetical protein
MILVILLTLLVQDQAAYKLTDLTNGPGIIPIKVQNSRIISDYYTYVHSINLTTIQDELDNLLATIKITKTDFANSIQEQVSLARTKILEAHINYAKYKFEHVFLNNHKRIKRGLINGLGTAISWLTGNMDAKDKEKYDQIINKLEKNEYRLEHNVENSLAVNEKMIEDFNKEMSLINQNNFRIAKILNNSVAKNIEWNQKYIIWQSTIALLTNRINDIDDSIEFCKLNIIHNSIINSHELKEISDKEVKLISNSPEILWQTGKIKCSLTATHLYYFLELPRETPLVETYFLLSYPYTNPSGQIVTTHVYPSIVLKNDNLCTGECSLLLNTYYCNNVTRINNECIESILTKGRNKQCISYELANVEPFIKYIDVINQYLVFKNKQLYLNKNNNRFVINLKEAMLIKLDSNESIDNFEKLYNYIETENVPIDVIEYKTKTINITFEQLHKLNVKMKPMELLDEIVVTNHYVYIYILIGTLFIIVSFLIFIKIRDRLMKCKSPSEIESPTIPIQDELPPHMF